MMEHRHQMAFFRGVPGGRVRTRLDEPKVGADVQIVGLDHGKTTVFAYRPGWSTEQNELHADVLVVREEAGTHWSGRGQRSYHSPEIKVYERRGADGWWYPLIGWELGRGKGKS